MKLTGPIRLLPVTSRTAVDDPEVAITELGTFGTHLSQVSPVDDPVFRTLAATIRQIHPDTVVAPCRVVGVTDSRHFQTLSPRIYRFIPFVVPAQDISGIHGANERITIDSYLDGIRLYRQLIINMT